MFPCWIYIQFERLHVNRFYPNTTQYTKFLCESSKAFMFRHAEKNCGNSCVHERYVNIGYNYVPQTMFGRHIVFAPFLITSPWLLSGCIAILRFFFTIILILPHIFVRLISQRCLDKTLWNFVEISYAMWSCAFKGRFFQNGCRCHGNGQMLKKIKTQKWS
jgi:hypothetical protein